MFFSKKKNMLRNVKNLLLRKIDVLKTCNDISLEKMSALQWTFACLSKTESTETKCKGFESYQLVYLNN